MASSLGEQPGPQRVTGLEVEGCSTEDEGAPLFVVAVSCPPPRSVGRMGVHRRHSGELAPGELLLVIKRGWRAPGLGAINVGAGNGGAGEREQTVARSIASGV